MSNVNSSTFLPEFTNSTSSGGTPTSTLSGIPLATTTVTGDLSQQQQQQAFNPLLFIIPVCVGLSFIFCFCFSRYLPYLIFRLRKNPTVTYVDHSNLFIVKCAGDADSECAFQNDSPKPSVASPSPLQLYIQQQQEQRNAVETDDTVSIVSFDNEDSRSCDPDQSSSSLANANARSKLDSSKSAISTSKRTSSNTYSTYLKRFSSSPSLFGSASNLSLASASAQSLVSINSSNHISNGIVDIQRSESPPKYASP